MDERCRSVPETAAREAGETVARRLLALPEVGAAARVALYAALADELPTRPAFAALRAAGTQVLFPRCRPDGRLDFAGVERWEDLHPGRYGVSEPRGGAEALAADDVVVVPCRAFDRRGFRVGRGGGYYDRSFPPGAPDVPFLVGLGYALQEVEAVPDVPHDRMLDAVVTERETLRTRGRGQA